MKSECKGSMAIGGMECHVTFEANDRENLIRKEIEHHLDKNNTIPVNDGYSSIAHGHRTFIEEDDMVKRYYDHGSITSYKKINGQWSRMTEEKIENYK